VKKNDASDLTWFCDMGKIGIPFIEI
jgi:hypothetical protein